MRPSLLRHFSSSRISLRSPQHLTIRFFTCSPVAHSFDSQQPSNVIPGGAPNTPIGFATAAGGESSRNERPEPKKKGNWRAVWDISAQTVAGLGLVSIAGLSYYHFYKWHVLHKIAKSFDGGFDPVLELDKAKQGNESKDEMEDGELWFRRPQQDLIDRIVMGDEVGSYYLLLGPKGTGKTSMVVEAMRSCDAAGVSFCEAHEDPEVFRLRLGKSLNFEFHEDSINGLFQRKDPREAGAILDIERALNKLEKVAISHRKKTGKPLVLIFNNIHYLRNDEQGVPILHALQQRAESWAQSGVLTMVFNSDDAWIFDKMKTYGTRLKILTIEDLDQDTALKMIKSVRLSHFGERLGDADAFRVWDMIGGRPSHIHRVVKSENMEKAAREFVDFEAAWLEAKLGLIVDCDDDVMDEQKYSSSSFLLFQELVAKADEIEAEEEEKGSGVKDGHVKGYVTYGRARQVMTRADFLPSLDSDRIVTIDVNHHVRADSRAMLNAFRKLVHRPNFQQDLDSVRARIDEIESLHRTAELTWKDQSLMRVRVARDTKPDPPEEDDD